MSQEALQGQNDQKFQKYVKEMRNLSFSDFLLQEYSQEISEWNFKRNQRALIALKTPDPSDDIEYDLDTPKPNLLMEWFGETFSPDQQKEIEDKFTTMRKKALSLTPKQFLSEQNMQTIINELTTSTNNSEKTIDENQLEQELDALTKESEKIAQAVLSSSTK